MGGVQKSIAELTILYKNIMNFLLKCIDPSIDLILFYGSLLGYYRDSNFINLDDDIDMILSRDHFDILKINIKKNIHLYPTIRIGIEKDDILQLYDGENGPFDLYPFDEYGDDILIKWDGNLLFEKKHIFPLQRVSFHDTTICIPHDTEVLLLQIYGSNWKIPQLKYIDYSWKEINTVRMCEIKKD